MASWIKRSIVVFFVFVLSNKALAVTQISHVIVQDPRNQLILDILSLALDNSDLAGDYEYVPLDEALTEARMVEYIKSGTLTVTWLGTQLQYEEQLRPIRIPILKGMLGHRVFIIRQGDQSRFSNVRSLEDLKRIPLGQGKFWGDTHILREAGMNVVDPVKYESLFHMLEGGRFDYFPRAIHEPWNEVTRWDELNLTVENNLLLVYPFALYFFVSRDNPQLGSAIENGFLKAIDDGSFNKLFFENEGIKETLSKSNLKNRTVFRLNNPFMHPDTPVDNEKLWLNVNNL